MWRMLGVLLCMGSAMSMAAEPVITRETWDAFGRVVRKITTQGDKVLAETTLEYDAAGRPIQVKTLEGTKQTVDKTTYGPQGTVEEEKIVDGKTVLKTTRTSSGGKVSSIRTEDAEGKVRVTTFTYNLYGNLVKSQVVDGEGKLVSETLADIPRPAVPINANLSIGSTYLSDVNMQDITVGFGIDREPAVRKVGADPLAVKVKGSYRRTSSGETLINNMTQLNFQAAFRRVLPWLSIATEAAVVRNPVAQLNLDLLLTPVGARFVILEPPAGMLLFDISPTWNYRTVQTSQVVVDENGVESTLTSTKELSVIRAKAQLYSQGALGPVSYTNYALFAPQVLSLDSEEALTPLELIDQRSIFTDELELGLQLSRYLTLTQTFKYTRDMTLKNQAKFDETGTCISASTLCDGYTFTSLTSLRFNFSYVR